MPGQRPSGGLPALLRDAYGLEVGGCSRLPGGTATDNWVVVDDAGRRWFAKVYRDPAGLAEEEAAIELAGFARAAGLPVPALRRTVDGRLTATAGSASMSLWEHVADAETAEGGLTGGRWASVGSVLGRLHRRLARHPAAAPELRPATGLHRVDRARERYDELVEGYRRRRPRSGTFESWALDAARQRRGLLDRAGLLLQELPALTTQVLHGDLAAPNVLLRGDAVAALVDFRPPGRGFASWEIARIGCDPRTVVGDEDWVGGLAVLLAAYRRENPDLPVDDLLSTLAVGCAYTLSSTYPLAEPLRDPGAVDGVLEAYARARHDAALRMLDQVLHRPSDLRDALQQPSTRSPPAVGR